MAVKFKGVDLDGDLERIIPHVATAEEYGGALQHLQTVWDNLTLLGQLSGTGTDMTETRHAFSDLAGSLLNQLGREALKKCLQDHSAKAQVAINILVRNLFERTADIGFLSSDEEIRTFLRRKAAGQDADVDALRKRFGEYVRKYSVYSDIVVLNTSGHVLARLDATVPMTVSQDPAIRAALDTTAAYVETFHETDLVAGGKRALIYSFRVTDHDGAILGVLCLCFRFEDEARTDLFEPGRRRRLERHHDPGRYRNRHRQFRAVSRSGRRQPRARPRCRIPHRAVRPDGICRRHAGGAALSGLWRARMVRARDGAAAACVQCQRGERPRQCRGVGHRAGDPHVAALQFRYPRHPAQGQPHPAGIEPLGLERRHPPGLVTGEFVARKLFGGDKCGIREDPAEGDQQHRRQDQVGVRRRDCRPAHHGRDVAVARQRVSRGPRHRHHGPQSLRARQ